MTPKKSKVESGMSVLIPTQDVLTIIDNAQSQEQARSRITELALTFTPPNMVLSKSEEDLIPLPADVPFNVNPYDIDNWGEP